MNKTSAKEKLIEKYYSYRGKFIGLIHCTHIDNFVKIINDKYIYSRNSKKHIIDTADPEQVEATRKGFPTLLDYTRFYLIPRTPAYHATKYIRPVIIVIDPKILLKTSDVLYINKQVNSKSSRCVSDAEDALDFDYVRIFDPTFFEDVIGSSKGSVYRIRSEGSKEYPQELQLAGTNIICQNYSTKHYVLHEELTYNDESSIIVVHDVQYYKHVKNAEVAIRKKVSIDDASVFYFKNDADMNEVINKLGRNNPNISKFKVNRELF